MLTPAAAEGMTIMPTFDEAIANSAAYDAGIPRKPPPTSAARRR